MSEKINNTPDQEQYTPEVPPVVISVLGNAAIKNENEGKTSDRGVVEHQQAVDARVNSIVKSLKQEVYGSDNPDSQVLSQILNYLSNAIVEMRTIDPSSEKATYFDDQLGLMRESLHIANTTGVFNRNDFDPPLARLEQETQ